VLRAGNDPVLYGNHLLGKTGNARSVGCHLHFEIHVLGRPIDPEPVLSRWDRSG
jgi:murein DD-endopeptidase MepM/ murein hydrolase activator NlpD